MNTSMRSLIIGLAAICVIAACIHAHNDPMSRNIVFIGDSLTQWFDWQRRFPQDTVMNLGIAGETVEGLLSRRETMRKKLREPKYIFVMAGINDLIIGRYDLAAPYGELVRDLTIRYHGSTVVVQSILPSEFPGLESSIIEETNRQLAQIARDYHAEYLDVHARFLDANGNIIRNYLNDDGIHLTGKGYEAWSHEVERFLRRR